MKRGAGRHPAGEGPRFLGVLGLDVGHVFQRHRRQEAIPRVRRPWPGLP
ncbi:hypothetical protein ACRAWD_21765 [Caulobacter segnis]